MREIKFRARHAGIPPCWIYGYFVVEDGGCFIVNKEGKFMVRAGTESQYIGFKDKNDKEIYEGDIVQAYEDVYTKGLVKTGDPETVEYSAAGFLPFIIPCHGGELLIDNTEFEVIGNKWENPELGNNSK